MTYTGHERRNAARRAAFDAVRDALSAYHNACATTMAALETWVAVTRDAGQSTAYPQHLLASVRARMMAGDKP